MNSKQNRLALALVAAAGLASVASGQVFSNGSPTAITDSPTVVSTINVSGFVGTISDLNVVFNADHTFCGDLDVILIPPGQTGISYLQLFTDVGGAGDNFRWTRLDQGAAAVIGSTGNNTAPFTADYRPEGGTMTSTNWAALAPWALASLGTGITDLSSLNGIDPNGTWTLVIDDDAGGDVGTLQYWSLEFNGAVDSSVPPFSVGTGTLASNRLLQGQSTNATVLVTTRSGGAGPSTVQVAGAPCPNHVVDDGDDAEENDAGAYAESDVDQAPSGHSCPSGSSHSAGIGALTTTSSPSSVLSTWQSSFQAITIAIAVNIVIVVFVLGIAST